METLLTGICFSTFQPGGSLPTEDSAGGSQVPDGSTPMADETMVDRAHTDERGAPPTDTRNSHLKSGNRGEAPTQKTQTDSLHCVRKALEKKNISNRAIEIILKSWRLGTQKQYNVYIKKWLIYCNTNKTNIFTPRTAAVLDFLAELSESGLKYSAINTARGALSAIITPDKGITIGSHPLVKRLLKGIFEMSPPTPRYTQTWDVNKVLSFIRKQSPVKLLSLKNLTIKLVILLALVSAQRTQSIQLLRLDNLVTGPSYKFFLSDNVKQSRPGKPGLVVELAPYPPDRRTCIITVLKEYIKRTKTLRGTEQQLLVSYMAPHTKVSRDTIARWIKSAMTQSGINTELFKAHSTRAAATSKAARAATPINDILKAGGWASAGTFAKFYHKKLESAFANNVLQ